MSGHLRTIVATSPTLGPSHKDISYNCHQAMLTFIAMIILPPHLGNQKRTQLVSQVRWEIFFIHVALTHLVPAQMTSIKPAKCA